MPYSERELRPGVIERSWIGPGDPPAITRAGGTAALVQGGTRPTARSSTPSPELRETSSRDFTVLLSLTALAKIEREIEDANAFCGRTVETGGLLFAHDRGQLREVFVIHASGPGEGARHAPDAVTLAPMDVIKGELSETLRRAGLVVVGDWHSEPGYSLPSAADRQAWAIGFEDRSRPWPWASIVRDAAGDFHAYLTRHDGKGGVCVEPVRFDTHYA